MEVFPLFEFFTAGAICFIGRDIDGSRFARFHPNHCLLEGWNHPRLPDLEVQRFGLVRDFKYRTIIQSAHIVNLHSVTRFCLCHSPLVSHRWLKSKMVYSEAMQRSRSFLGVWNTMLPFVRSRVPCVLVVRGIPRTAKLLTGSALLANTEISLIY